MTIYTSINRLMPFAKTKPLPGKSETPTNPATIIPSTAVITCSYGNVDDLKRSAVQRALDEWGSQDYAPSDGIFIELVLPGLEPMWEHSSLPSWMRYIKIYGKERNRNIFQKEALWNIATKMTDANKLCYLDNDVMPLDNKKYFKQLFDATVPGTVVHAGWKLVAEKEPVNIERYSYMVDPKDKRFADKAKFPGLGYCLTREDYIARDGFNPMSIPGSGDAIFIWESCQSVTYPVYNARKYHQGITRKGLPQLKPYAVPGMVVQHNFHGPYSNRAYRWSREVMQLFGNPNAYCHLDSAGLVAWNDVDFLLKDILANKSRMPDKDSTYQYICEIIKKRLDIQDSNDKSNTIISRENTDKYN